MQGIGNKNLRRTSSDIVRDHRERQRAIPGTSTTIGQQQLSIGWKKTELRV
jgi:hypothetical protein